MRRFRRWLPFAVVLGALLAAGGLGLGRSATTEAATTTFNLTLTGDKEVPPVTGGGSATAQIVFNTQTHQLSYTITVQGVAVSDITAAHIHLGVPGVSGPVLIPLSLSKSSLTSTGTVTLTDQEVAYLNQGSLYVNVHSVQHPDGFARAQLVLDAEAQIRANYDDIVAAFNSQNVEGFISHFTDAGLESTFGVMSRDEARQQLPSIMAGGPISIMVQDVSVKGNTATAHATLNAGGSLQAVTHTWVLQNGQWLIDNETQQIVPIPAGVKTIDMKLQEYAFVYDKSAIPADGNFAFSVTNVGTMDHEVDVAKIPADMTKEQLLQIIEQSGPDSPPPPGVEDLGSVGPISPGAQANLVFPQPLAPGHYVLLCFVTGPDGVPHAVKGMIDDFTVGAASGTGTSTGGGGTITPPNTGDAGLKTGATNMGEGLLILAMLISFAGASGLALSRRTAKR